MTQREEEASASSGADAGVIVLVIVMLLMLLWHVAIAAATVGHTISDFGATADAFGAESPLTITGAERTSRAGLIIVIIGELLVISGVAGLWMRHKRRASMQGLATSRQLSTATRVKGFEDIGTIAVLDGRKITLTARDTVLMVATPQSGKTSRYAAYRVNDAPGPVVATSTKVDLLRATQAFRRERGEVHVFDPSGVSTWTDRTSWNIIGGCEDPEIAMKRAEAMVAAAPLGDAKNADAFEKFAKTVLRCYLHAAAIKPNGSIRDVLDWASDFDDEEPYILLRDSKEAPTWRGDLLQMTRSESYETVGSIRIALSTILECLKLEKTVRWLMPGGLQFDVEAFLDSDDALYLLSESGRSNSAAPILTALVSEIERAARLRSQHTVTNRLEKTLTLVLDEAANIAPIPTLPELISDGGGRGISVHVLVQGASQLRDRWGKDGADTVFAAASVRLILGGGMDADWLEELSKLGGTRQSERVSEQTSRTGSSRSVTYDRERILDPDEIRRLDDGEALLMYRKLPPAIVEMRGYWESRKRKAFEASVKDSLEREGLTDVRQ